MISWGESGEKAPWDRGMDLRSPPGPARPTDGTCEPRPVEGTRQIVGVGTGSGGRYVPSAG